MKRRTINAQRKKLRDRRSGMSPYLRYRKVPYLYRWHAPWKRACSPAAAA